MARLARLGFRGQSKLEVNRLELRLPAWPDTAGSLRVVVASDFHAGVPEVGLEELDAIVDLIHAQEPELILLAGDYIDRQAALSENLPHHEIALRLGRLRAPLGVHAVLGNHDWRHDGEKMAKSLAGAGVRVLENEAVPVDDGRFWIAGLADATKREPDLAGTLRQIPAGAPTIVLSHNPDVFPHVPATVALTVAGHTHGAQVDIPVIRDKVTPSDYGARYTGGHIEENGKHLYVSSGIGTSTLPIRFRAPPEIAVLHLGSDPVTFV